MTDNSKSCETCPWPLDCCTGEDAAKTKPAVEDCPRDHKLWERRLDQARLSFVSGVSMIDLAELEEEDLVGV